MRSVLPLCLSGLLAPIALSAAALASPDPAPEAADPVRAPATEAPVIGTLRRRGVRGPAIGVEVRAETVDGQPISAAFTDAAGAFALTVPQGPIVLRVDDPAYRAAQLALDVPPGGSQIGPWGLDPQPGRDDTVRVYGRRPPAAVALDAEALRTAAGTLGDPLRAVQSLPSVGTILSSVPFPIVRGSAPGDTAIRVDGTAIPLLFHSGVGQGVVPAVLVERITLHASGAPIDVGQHVTAIEVTTAEPDDPGLRGDILLDLVQAGALVSAPLGDHHRITVSGRLGYPGWILDLLDQPVLIDFSDYHLRYTWRSGRRRARISLFGATDRFGDAEPSPGQTEPPLTEMAFHRLALRWFEPLGAATLEVAVDLGFDRFGMPDLQADDLAFFRSAAGVDLDELSARARLIARVPLTRSIDLEAGIEQSLVRTENGAFVLGNDPLLVDGVRDRLGTGVWIRTALTAGPVEIEPGVRIDIHGDPWRWAVDPRLDARLGIGGETAVLGRVGVTHAPQRYPYPIPGIGEYASEPDLHRTLHGQLGVEQILDGGFDVRWSIFGRRTDGIKASALDPVRATTPRAAYEDYAYGDARAWGSELMLRRRPGGWIHGWLSYTVQRVERRLDDPRLYGDGPWHRSLLEQNHLLNAVLTARLPAGWRFGVRVHYASGRPAGLYGSERLDGYIQLDARIEYAWVADLYEGSAWIDVINATHAAEPTRATATEPVDAVAFTLPMLGVRARF